MGLRDVVSRTKERHHKEEIARLLNIVVRWILSFNQPILREGKVQQLIYMALSTKVSDLYPWEVAEELQYHLERMSIFYRTSEGIVVMPVIVQAILLGENPSVPPASKRAAEKIADELRRHGTFQQYGGKWRYNPDTGDIEITVEFPG